MGHTKAAGGVPRHHGNKFFRGMAGRGAALACALALLLPSVPAGLAAAPAVEVRALAGVDDLPLLVEYLRIVSALACASGGADNSEMLTTADREGITGWQDARGYVHGSMSGSSSFRKFMDSVGMNTQKVMEMEVCVASAFFMGGYVMKREFMEKLFGSSEDVLTRSPDRDGWDYDPARDGWDRDRYSGLTDEQKEQVFLEQQVLDMLEEVKNTPSFMSPPDPDYDFGDDDDDDAVREKLKDRFNENGDLLDGEGNPVVLDEAVVSAAFDTALFRGLYALTKRANRTEARAHLSGEAEGDGDAFRYTFEDWKKERNIAYMESAALAPGAPGLLNIGIRFTDQFFGTARVNNNPSLAEYSPSRIFPCLYWGGGGPCLGITTDRGVWRCPYALEYFYKMTSSSGGGYVAISPSSGDIFSLPLYRNLWTITSFSYDEVARLLRERQSVDGYVRVCDAPWLVDCGTEDNFKKFSSLLQSGEYDPDDLLGCMADGWKSLPKKSWQAVDDGGETAKKAMSSEKGKKYKKTGTRASRKEDGTVAAEKDREGVSFSSLVSGMQSVGENTLSSPAPATQLGDILGEQTDHSEPYPFPDPLPESWPRPDPLPGPGGSTGDGTPDPTPTPGPTSSPDPGSLPLVPGTDSGIHWYERFPFCIPWDLYSGVSALNAETKVPRFVIPFKIERLGIDEKITVDFSRYEKLGVMCRWFLRILFAVGLAMVSRYIIKG